MTVAALPSIHSLPPAERQPHYDAALERVMASASAAAAEHKARKPDPRAGDYLSWKSKGLVCVLVVKHRDAANSIAVTRDGSNYPHVYLPNSKTIVLRESCDEFVLALVSRSFVAWLETKDFVAGSRFRELFGITLPLSPARPWTDAQAATWKRLDSARTSINYKIQTARMTPRKSPERFRFGEYA